MAQTRAAGYESAARWMHSAWVTAKGEKMSKSLGTGLSVPSVLAEHSAWVVRYALGSVQYRSMLEWSDQALVEARAAYERIMNFIERAGVALGEQPERAEIAGVSADDLPADFVSAMNDDVNVSGATAAIFTAIRNGNTLLSKLDDRADGDAARAEVRSAWSRCGRCWMRWDWIRWPSRGPVPQARTATARAASMMCWTP